VIHPDLVVTNSADEAFGNAVVLGQVNASVAAASDMEYISLGELGPAMRFAGAFAQDARTVKPVLAAGHPLQVADRVIGLVTIFVVDLWQPIRVWQKRLGHKAMQIAIDSAAPIIAAVEADKPVAVACEGRAQWSRRVADMSISPAPVLDTRHTSADNGAVLRDGVTALITGDFPGFQLCSLN